MADQESIDSGTEFIPGQVSDEQVAEFSKIFNSQSKDTEEHEDSEDSDSPLEEVTEEESAEVEEPSEPEESEESVSDEEQEKPAEPTTSKPEDEHDVELDVVPQKTWDKVLEIEGNFRSVSKENAELKQTLQRLQEQESKYQDFNKLSKKFEQLQKDPVEFLDNEFGDEVFDAWAARVIGRSKGTVPPKPDKRLRELEEKVQLLESGQKQKIQEAYEQANLRAAEQYHENVKVLTKGEKFEAFREFGGVEMAMQIAVKHAQEVGELLTPQEAVLRANAQVRKEIQAKAELYKRYTSEDKQPVENKKVSPPKKSQKKSVVVREPEEEDLSPHADRQKRIAEAAKQFKLLKKQVVEDDDE